MITEIKKITNLEQIKKNLQPTLSALSFPVKIEGCSSDQIKNLNSLAKNTSEKIPDIIKKIEEY